MVGIVVVGLEVSHDHHCLHPIQEAVGQRFFVLAEFRERDRLEVDAMSEATW